MKNWKLPNKFWYILALLLCIPAFLINLDLITLKEDESIRALVALEMLLSGDYFTPTLNDTLYYSKPPLYNWLLNISFFITGRFDEWALRLPTVFFLGLFAISIFFFTNKYFDRQFAFINALLFITCGRILFWDSMLGYIDICYSMVTYTELMVIYYFYEKKAFNKLFIISYFLAAVAFMLKGFPTFLFQGLTLLALFTFDGKFKKLFTREHLFGILLFSLLIGSYYLYYFTQNPENQALTGLLDQSTRRTLIHDKHNLWDFLEHLILYPFQNLYDFFPWSIMVMYMFRRDILKLIFDNKLITYCCIAFGVNILVYWISIEVYPRYILMLVPLLFTVFLYFHQKHYRAETILYKVFVYFSLFVIVLGLLFSMVAPFLSNLNDIPYPVIKGYIVAFPLLFCALYFYLHKPQRLITLVCALVLIRIGFNFFILPDRYYRDKATGYKAEAIAIGEKYRDEDLRIWESTKIDYTSSFYISSTRGKITTREYDEKSSSVFYVIDTLKYDIPIEYKEIETFQVREGDRILTVIQQDTTATR